MASNYDDVLSQIELAGLMVGDGLIVGKMTRCRVVGGGKEKRGWYSLHNLVTSSGDELLVGSFGVWEGPKNNAQKVALEKHEISSEQRESLRRRIQEDRKRADRARQAEADRAALTAQAMWARMSPTGESEYLARKGVGAHGVRFSAQGALVVPMLDVAGRVHGLQVIRSKKAATAKGKREKEYWPPGVATKAHFHMIGAPTWIVLVCEGYATGATLHEATSLPVCVAFDAGNLLAVAGELRRRWKTVRILFCADDDIFAKCHACSERFITAANPVSCPHCGKEHHVGNAGVSFASSAAVEVGGAWVRPSFRADDERRDAFLAKGTKLSDFNDLHAAEGLHVVRAQVDAKLTELKWHQAAARATSNNGGKGEALRPIDSLEDLLTRYALVYGHGGVVFDRQEHVLLSLSDMRDACIDRGLHRAWAEHPERAMVRIEEVGFDPAGTDPQITCNLWSGWPTEPKPGCCEKLLQLLWYMTGTEAEQSRRSLFEWVLRWVAYPIQNPGAKLKSTIVIHGPQGTGKNLFFEVVMAIYGRYGRLIDQVAIEDKFNDWASRKLFLIADEVVARSDLFHIKNRLKAFITGDCIRINPKNLAAYDERNHVNLVFLSNEAQPVVLEEDDRRHAVLWTPEKLEPEFYREVRAEIASGGVAALHDYLLNHVAMGTFDEGAQPPMTAAKLELINLSMDSTSRFYYALEMGDLPVFPISEHGLVRMSPALATDVFNLYRTWCGRVGAKPAPMSRLMNALDRKHRAVSRRKRYHAGGAVTGPHSVVMFGGDRPPADDGRSELAWLGEAVTAFRTALSDWHGSERP